MTYFQQRLAFFSRKLDRPFNLGVVHSPKHSTELNDWVVVKTKGTKQRVVGFNLTKQTAALLVTSQITRISEAIRDLALISFEVISETKARKLGLLP